MFVQLWLETVSTFQILITNAEQVNSEIYLLFRFSVHYSIIGMKVFAMITVLFLIKRMFV